jgi:hypothetical protein
LGKTYFFTGNHNVSIFLRVYDAQFCIICRGWAVLLHDGCAVNTEPAAFDDGRIPDIALHSAALFAVENGDGIGV